MKEGSISHIPAQDALYLQTAPLIRRLIAGKLRAFHFDSVDDLAQKVALKLWHWKSRRPDLHLAADEWAKVANTAVQNGVRDFYNSRVRREVPLSEIGEAESCISCPDGRYNGSPEGNTNAEVRSLLKQLWSGMRDLSLRQKYALLLGNEAFIIDFIRQEVCTRRQAAEALEINEEELTAVIESLPFDDHRIKDILEEKLGAPVTIKQVWEARGKAKAKLSGALSDARKNERPSPAGKT